VLDYYTDDIGLGGGAGPAPSSRPLRGVQFGVADVSEDLNEGVLGLGYGRGRNLRYNNLVDELLAQNVTATRAFSVALGSVADPNPGAIIFGGVDTRKFSGALARLPVLPPQGDDALHRYWVALDSVGTTGPGGGGAKVYPSSSGPVVIDSGSTLSLLPAEVVRMMAQDLGGQYSSREGVYFVSCAQKQWAERSGHTVDFRFGGGAVVSVPFSEFVWHADDRHCVLGAQAVTPGMNITAILGDTFMRGAYTVFDQTNDAVWVGNYANCGKNEVAIPAGANGVANLTGECPAQNMNPGNPNGASTSFGISVWTAMVAVLGVVMVNWS
jgi:hypothetical protein